MRSGFKVCYSHFLCAAFLARYAAASPCLRPISVASAVSRKRAITTALPVFTSPRATTAIAPSGGAGSRAVSSGCAPGGRATRGGLRVWSIVGTPEAVTAIRRSMPARRIIRSAMKLSGRTPSGGGGGHRPREGRTGRAAVLGWSTP